MANTKAKKKDENRGSANQGKRKAFSMNSNTVKLKVMT
jgi:hypothetical protein